MKYPLNIERWQDNLIGSKGHHDISEFIRQIKLKFNIPIISVMHIHLKAIPDSRNNYGRRYIISQEGARATFPATVVIGVSL